MYAATDEKQTTSLLSDEENRSEREYNYVFKGQRKYSWTVITLCLSNLLLLIALMFSNHSRLFSPPNSQSNTSLLSSSPSQLDKAEATAGGAQLLAHTGIFITEIADALPFVQYEERGFVGELAYNITSKELYREVDPTEPQYFGRPSPLIDAAWKELMTDEYMVMKEEEAAPLGDELKRVMGKKRMEPSYMHALHCLNAIRKEIDHDYYSSKPNMWHHYPAEFARTHADHCMDFLFQQVTCAADLTPSPLYVYEGFDIAIGRTGKHTCRNWGKLREWIRGRSSAGEVGGHHEHEGHGA